MNQPRIAGAGVDQDNISNYLLAKYSLVNLTITGDNKIREIRLGRAMNAFNVSATSQTKSR